MGFFGEGGNRAMEKLVLQKTKGAFNLSTVGIAKLAVQAGKQLRDDGLTPGVEVLAQPRDPRPVPAPAPLFEKTSHFLGDDGFGRLHVREAVTQGLLANPLQIIDVK